MKYELTDETKTTENGTVLHRICALRDIPRYDVSKGDLGGWVETESNLSHDEDAWIAENAMVYGNAWVYGNAVVWRDAQVGGNAMVGGDAIVGGNAKVGGNARVFGDAQVGGNAMVGGNALVYGNAVVRSSADYLVFKNSWSSFRWFTYTRSNKMWKVGCFCGTGEDLIKKAYADSAKSGRCYEAIVRAVEAIESATAEEGGEK